MAQGKMPSLSVAIGGGAADDEGTYEDQLFDDLVAACNEGDLQEVETLLRTGGVEAENLTNRTFDSQEQRIPQPPLFAAVARGHEEVVRFLLKHNADPNACDSQGRTCLYPALLRDRRDLVQLLVEEAGANMNECDGDDSSAAHVAAKAGAEGCLRYVMEKEPSLLHSRNAAAKTPLHKCAGETRCLEYLLGLPGVDINALDSDGATCLFEAALFAAPSTKLLLKHGCAVDHVAADGQTALHACAMYGNVEAIRELMLAGADVTVRDHDQHTAVDVAVENEYTEAAAMLDGRVPLTEPEPDDEVESEPLTVTA